jgi:protease-4
MQDQVEKSRWEQEVLEKTLMANVTEHRRSRRWGIFFKLIILGYVIFLTAIWMGAKGKPALKDHVWPRSRGRC